MRASFTTDRDGSIALHLDSEAARGVFASVLFAARFHEGLTPLAAVAEEVLREHDAIQTNGEPSCR